MFQKRFLTMLLSIGLGISILFTGMAPAAISADNEAVAQQVETSTIGYGTEDRNWVTETETLTPERYEVTVEENIEITVRDGTVIRGRLMLPKGLEGPYPTIVQLNGYGHGEYGNSFETLLIDLAERGFAVLHVSMRGSGTSDGEAGLYNFFGEDGYDVIEWAADQEWSNGNVGTAGLSLLGISQWLAAKELPPSLKAISPVVACTDCYEYLWYPGGMEAGPGRVARGYEYEVASEHRNYDEWWQERSVSPEQLKEIADHGVSALISGGWNDYISPGNVKAFELYSAAGGDSKLIMYPGAHANLSGVQPYEFNDYQAMWFEHYLTDEDNGVDERDPVLIYVQGADQWRYEKSWPLHDTNYVDLYFSHKYSKSIDSINGGAFTSKEPRRQESFVSYSYSPEDGPFLPSLLSSSGRLQINQQPYEKNHVTWTTDSLVVPTEVTGNMSVSFWAEADAEDADFVVQISDVAPDGTSKQVTAGYLNASRAESRTTPTPLTPGEVEQYEIEILPTSYVFEEGHRIRLTIAGGAKPLEGQQAPQGPGINQTASTVKIYQDVHHPSHLTLPVIGQDSLKTTRGNYEAVKNSADNGKDKGKRKN